jgi:hypothetical protein
MVALTRRGLVNAFGELLLVARQIGEHRWPVTFRFLSPLPC